MAGRPVGAVTPEPSVKIPTAAHPPATEKVAVDLSPVEDEQLNDTLQELQDARDAMARKDAKITALRRDLESMRMQLETKDKELRAVKSTQQTQPKRETRNKAELTVR
jgi:chromosome segregation ATPase